MTIKRTGIYRVSRPARCHFAGEQRRTGRTQIRELLRRIEDGQTRELITATNLGMEGDATAMYLQRDLAGTNINVTRLARGLPTDGDLEYVDSLTLMRALEGRTEL